MKRRTKITVWIFTLFLSVALASGCTDAGKKAKDQMLDALSNQQQITSQTYSGSVRLDLGSLPIPTDDQPYTSVIFNALKNGKISWSGGQHKGDKRSEVEFRFLTSDSSTEFIVPIIMHSDKMYIHVPMINGDDEYFVMPRIAQAEKISTTALKSLSHIIEKMDKGWFSSTKSGDTQAIRMTITKDNWPSFLERVNEAMPHVLEEWQSAGIVTADQAQSVKGWWKNLADDGDNRIRPIEDKDSFIEIKTDDQNHIITIKSDFAFEAETRPSTFEPYQFVFEHVWNSVNEDVSFTKDIPESTVSIDELLKFVP